MLINVVLSVMTMTDMGTFFLFSVYYQLCAILVAFVRALLMASVVLAAITPLVCFPLRIRQQ